jgi:23S rRNA pseudouridine955/2504/2580 synthase
LNPPQKPPQSAARQQQVEADLAGMRLDNFLLGRLKGVPRSHVYRLIRSGQVRVNSGRVGPGYRLAAGDRVRVPPVAVAPAAPRRADDGTLDWLRERIVYEDQRLLVLDKPAGLAAHGGSGVSVGAIEALRALEPTQTELELAHRLDRATSGCLLVAKRRSTLRVLHALLREGAVDKRYLALVRGRWPSGTTRIDAPLLTDRRRGDDRVKVGTGGKHAESVFRLLETFGKTASLVEVSLRTGRTHQIRVHAAHAGHPLAGDDRYGDRDFNAQLARRGLRRMFLHAHAVAFRWPDSGEEFSVSTPLPPELAGVLTTLGG